MAIWLGWRHACCLIAEVPVFLGWFSNCFFQKFNLPRKRPLWPPVWQHHSRRSVSHLVVRMLLWTFFTLKWEEIHFGEGIHFEYNQHNLDMEMIHMHVLVFSCSDLTVNRQITLYSNGSDGPGSGPAPSRDLLHDHPIIIVIWSSRSVMNQAEE